MTVLLLAVPVAAQNGYMRQTAAGKDFYFTLLDHWGWSGNSAAQPIKHVGISITAVEAADITFSTPLSNGGGASPSYTRHMDAGSSLLSSFAYPDQLVLQGVNIHSTGDLYINIWVHGGTSSDQSVILPKHLLGKHYIVQGIPGSIIESGEGIPTPTYSQFTVVGTENGTSVSVTPRVNMVCRSRSDTLINAGQVYTTSIQENEVLLFQPENYSHDISGTVVESDKAVAVFQGNNLTRFPADVNWADYTWEQARATEAWGKEFIVAGTGRLVEKAFAITALEDNTQVEFYIYSMRYKTVTLNRGETAWGGENISGYGGLGTEYIKSDKPVCCYMYTTGCTQNNDKGDPSMAEILPVDHMATEAHWGLIQTDENGPFSNTLLVTTRDDNTDKVKFNGRLLSEYATQSGVATYSIYGYTTYEIPLSVFGNLTTSGEGFSAYVVRVGKTAEAAAFNVTLPDPPPEPPCPEGKLLFQMTDKFVAKMWQELSGFCPGTKVSFSASVSSHRYNESSRLVIKDPATMRELVQYYKYVGLGNPAESYDIGLSYTIPEGVSDLFFQLENSDNALVSSFEVRLCTPPVEIIAPDSVCIDTKNILRAEFENDGTFAEPLQYRWYFSPDSVNWEAVNEGDGRELKLKAKPRHSGWYKVYVADEEKINDPNCRAESEPFKLFVIEDCPPILCPEGVLLKHDDLDGTATSYSTAIDGLCENMDLSLIINLPSGHAPCRLMLRLTDSETGSEILAYDTGDVPADSLQVGTTFTVPEGVQGVQWSISQNGGNGDFLIENTEVRLCLEPIRAIGSSPACRKKRHVFRGVYDNYGILENPEFRWEFSADSATWTTVQEGATMNYTIPVVHKSHEGWYRLSVAEAGNLDKPNCRETSEPFKLATQYCETATEQHIDTIVCDTLLVSGYAWRGYVWSTTGEVVDTLKDIDQDDSLYVHKTLEKKVCCPDILNYRVDTAVCDTLLPFVWLWRDRMLMFEDIGEQEVEIAHAKWESCVGEVYTLHLDTFHCERLYPIIVNKYNWLVLLDYKSLRRFFPDQTAVSFQWYRDSVAIEGGTGDDYSETQELHGHFQLRIQMNDGLYVWSNILDISDTPEPNPVHVRVYNSNGILLYEEDINDKPYTPVLPAGIYLLRYEQGEEVWTEKKVTL